jgi:dienelactone hydrolase
VEVKRLGILSDKVTRESVRVNGIVGTLFYPKTPGRSVTVITLGGSDGGLNETRARLLASRGYAAFALAYFGVETLPQTLEEIPLEYFAQALAWLKAQPAVNPDRIVVMGESKGGELALLLSATYPQDIKGVVAYVPSAVAYQGLGAGTRSSWALGGKPVPFLKYASYADCAEFLNRIPAASRCTYEKALDDPAAVGAASIAVEKINGSVLVISGTDDQVWPSPRYTEMVVTRLRSNGFKFAYEQLRYEGAGHLIGIPYLPSNQTQISYPGADQKQATYLLGGSAEANGTASADSYARVLGFLNAYVQ